MKKQFSNQEIYIIEKQLLNFIEEDFFLSIKVNFAISKNEKIFRTLADEIDNERLRIGNHYGALQVDEQTGESLYFIPKEKRLEAEQDLKRLFEIEQNVDIMMISLEDLQDVKLSTKQMQALLFMIEE